MPPKNLENAPSPEKSFFSQIEPVISDIFWAFLVNNPMCFESFLRFFWLIVYGIFETFFINIQNQGEGRGATGFGRVRGFRVVRGSYFYDKNSA